MITIRTNRERTATAGYIIKKAIFKCRSPFCVIQGTLVKRLEVAETLKGQTLCHACVCRGTLQRGTGVRTARAGAGLQAQ